MKRFFLSIVFISSSIGNWLQLSLLQVGLKRFIHSKILHIFNYCSIDDDNIVFWCFVTIEILIDYDFYFFLFVVSWMTPNQAVYKRGFVSSIFKKILPSSYPSNYSCIINFPSLSHLVDEDHQLLVVDSMEI